MKIRKYDGTNWVQQYPEVNVDAIVTTNDPDTATGTASDTFLRGDGSWQTVASSFNGGTITNNLTIDSASFASLTLDRESTTSSSIVQFTNNGGVVGGVGGFGNDGLQFRTTDGTQMVIDASNNVGIGTTSPTQKLDVIGDIRISNSNPVLVLNDTGTTTGNAYVDYQAGTSLKVHAGSDALTFVAGNAERARIANNGKMGLGTIAPGAMLHIVDSTSGSELAKFRNDGDTADITIKTTSGAVGVIKSGAGDPLQLSTNGSDTQGIRIDTSGNVGIGTTSPLAKLNVHGDSGLYITTVTNNPTDGAQIRFSDNTSQGQYGFIKYKHANQTVETEPVNSDDGFIIGGSEANTVVSIQGSLNVENQSNFEQQVELDGTDLHLNGVGTNTAPGNNAMKVSGYGMLANRGAVYFTNANASGDISFHIGNVHGSGDNLMRLIGSTSRVGIGTASPAEKLEVVGKIRASDKFQHKGTGGYYLYNSSMDFRGAFYDNGTSTQIYGDGNGSTPIITLESGDATFSNDVTVQGDLYVTGSFTTIDTNTSTTEQWSITNDGTGPAVIVNQVGDQPIMRLQDDGVTKVEFGDNGDIALSGADLTLGSGSYQHLARSSYITFYGDNSPNHSIASRNKTYGSDDDIRINTYGALLINLDSNNNNTSNASFEIGRHGGAGTISDWLFKVDGETGSVGIGTTSPASKLEVNGDIQLQRSNEIIFGETVGGNPRAVIFSTENEFSSDYNGLGFSIGNQGRTGPSMYIRSDGKVGIGTTSPSQKLEVEGNINANELHLNNTDTILKEGSGNSVRMQTNSGYIDIGPTNTGWGHIQTDRGRFYFNKGADFDGDVRMYSNNTTKMEESTGYIYELGNRVLTEASDVLLSYEFSPGSSAGSRRFVRLFTLNGFNNSSGAYADVILTGAGDYGDFDRTALRIIAGERGNAVTVDVFSLNAEDTTDAPIIYSKSTGTANTFEIWAQLADYNLQHRLNVLGKHGGFTVNLDSITTTTPSGLSTVTQKTLWHSGNDGNGSGLSADNLRGYVPQESASANSIAKRDGNGDLKANKFIDGNNTSYYIDSASTSVMNAVQFQTLQSNKTSYGEPSSENFYRLKIQNQGGTHNDVGLGQTASGNLGYNVTAANAHIFYEGTNGEIARLQPSGLALNHSGTGTVDSKAITFISQFNNTDVSRDLKTNSSGALLFNGNALATEAYVTANAGGGGVTSIKNFSGPYVNTNGFTAKQLPLSKTLSTGDRIGLSVIVGTTSSYGTRTQQTVWLEVGTSSHAVLFAYYDNSTSTMRLYSAEVYISSGNLYIDDAVAWTDGAFGHSGSSTSAIYVMDVLEYA